MTEFDHIDVTAKVQLEDATEGVDDEALAHEPTTLKQRVKDHVLAMTIALGCLVLGLLLIVAPFVALYYFLRSVGLDGVANSLVNAGALAVVMTVSIACVAVPCFMLARLVQVFQGDDQS
ncbi:hypothetical protein [Burkholderia gladioli]|uniref:hypothetical protein n=1 Tax=Burkholderia gladioli TaxID=28095 RepID=UPI0016401104|nr:hypothetical protein [Burkholderia gladioli]